MATTHPMTTTDKPSSKHDLEQFKQTHQIETSLHYNYYNCMAVHKPTGKFAYGVTERLAVINLCHELDMLEFPV